VAASAAPGMATAARTAAANIHRKVRMAVNPAKCDIVRSEIIFFPFF
jgi:hypothetical protein